MSTSGNSNARGLALGVEGANGLLELLRSDAFRGLDSGGMQGRSEAVVPIPLTGQPDVPGGGDHQGAIDIEQNGSDSG